MEIEQNEEVIKARVIVIECLAFSEYEAIHYHLSFDLHVNLLHLSNL